MIPWHEHEHWFEELRQFLVEQGYDDNLNEEDMMFVSNLAVQTMKGDISFAKAVEEIHKWERQKMGVLGHLSKEAFELELLVNHPDLIEVTRAVQENLRFAEEPGIADALIQVYAHPNFTEFVTEGSWVAMQHKGWFAMERLSPNEHQVVGWAIAQAVKELNDGN
jgi:hypothetical protein